MSFRPEGCCGSRERFAFPAGVARPVGTGVSEEACITRAGSEV